MRRVIFALLLFPMAALADTPAQPAPQPMPAAQRATEDMVLELVRLWQRHEIEKEQTKDALRDAQQNIAARSKEVQEKGEELQKEQAKSKDLETLVIKLQARMKQAPQTQGPQTPVQ